MKKTIQISLLLLFALLLTSFGIHKFYMAIYQVNFVPNKKRIEITARLFADDLNLVLEKKFHKKTGLGLATETPEDVVLMNKYLAEHVIFKINGTKKSFQFVSKELENNVLICYFKISDLVKITTLEIQNDAFVEQFSEQQNLIQSTIYGQKQSVLLTADTVFGTLK